MHQLSYNDETSRYEVCNLRCSDENLKFEAAQLLQIFCNYLYNYYSIKCTYIVEHVVAVSLLYVVRLFSV